MPIYKLKCESCGQTMEHFARSSKNYSNPPCSKCKGLMIKQASTFSFEFKGFLEGNKAGQVTS